MQRIVRVDQRARGFGDRPPDHSRLHEAGIRVAYVTHLYDLAESCYAHNAGEAVFLRAQRRPDGQRTFRLPEGEPLPTSYGEDLYRQVFGPEHVTAPA